MAYLDLLADKFKVKDAYEELFKCVTEAHPARRRPPNLLVQEAADAVFDANATIGPPPSALRDAVGGRGSGGAAAAAPSGAPAPPRPSLAPLPRLHAPHCPRGALGPGDCQCRLPGCALYDRLVENHAALLATNYALHTRRAGKHCEQLLDDAITLAHHRAGVDPPTGKARKALRERLMRVLLDPAALADPAAWQPGGAIMGDHPARGDVVPALRALLLRIALPLSSPLPGGPPGSTLGGWLLEDDTLDRRLFVMHLVLSQRDALESCPLFSPDAVLAGRTCAAVDAAGLPDLIAAAADALAARPADGARLAELRGLAARLAAGLRAAGALPRGSLAPFPALHRRLAWEAKYDDAVADRDELRRRERQSLAHRGRPPPPPRRAAAAPAALPPAAAGAAAPLPPLLPPAAAGAAPFAATPAPSPNPRRRHQRQCDKHRAWAGLRAAVAEAERRVDALLAARPPPIPAAVVPTPARARACASALAAALQQALAMHAQRGRLRKRHRARLPPPRAAPHAGPRQRRGPLGRPRAGALGRARRRRPPRAAARGPHPAVGRRRRRRRRLHPHPLPRADKNLPALPPRQLRPRLPHRHPPHPYTHFPHTCG
jgi:hypothetical protein